LLPAQDFFAAGHSKEQFRMMCLLQHYRASMDYSDDLLSASTALLGKFHAFFDTVTHHLQKANTEIQQSVPVIDKALIDLARGVASGAVPERAPAMHAALSSPSRRRRPDDIVLAEVYGFTNLVACQ
jgi:cysteinyl-tRNA synthetase